LHNTFSPTSHSAPVFLTTTPMQEVVAIDTKSFLKCACQSRLTECSHMEQ